MRKTAIAFTALVLAMVPGLAHNVAAQSSQDYGLPTLGVIQTAALSPSNGCQPGQDQSNSTLFLSAYSKQIDSPDLLFSSACGGSDFFQSSIGGDDMALVGDLGPDIKLEKVWAEKAFDFKYIFSFSDFTKFAMQVPVTDGHTYAVLIVKSQIRGLFVFTVTHYEPNQKVVIKYAVKEYQVLGVTAQSPGYSPTTGNQQP